MELNSCSPEIMNNLTAIFNELSHLYGLYFGRRLAPVNLEIDNSDGSDLLYPRTCRGIRSIILYCPDYYPPQFYYQLSHELCRWMIPRDVPDKLRWLEEVIAVMAPPFFAFKVTAVDRSILVHYLMNEFKSAVPVSFSELFDPDSETIRILENNNENYTDYARYETIALRLLPTVSQNPLFWKAVPYLCDIQPGYNLKISFDRWLALIEESDVHTALAQVIRALQ